MTDPFLIAHKVRGEPAFDIAIRFRCPICEAAIQGLDKGTASWGCNECDGDGGWWWIIPTSGHRAYPYWNRPLKNQRFFHEENDGPVGEWLEQVALYMPPSLPDHYPPRHEPDAPRIDISGLLAPAPAVKIQRRF